MARISGVNIPSNKKIYIALTYIFGIGRKSANDICQKASIDQQKRINECICKQNKWFLNFIR